MRILAIDTSNDPLGVCVIEADKVVAEYSSNLKRNHSIRVMPAVEMVLRESGIKPRELDKIVVAEGPGSYTGVRIGVTIAKTMAWTLGIPLTGVSSLETLAAGARHFEGIICPLFDARRGQVYTGLFQYEDGTLQRIEGDQLIMINDLAEKLLKQEKRILFIGNDTALHKETIQSVLGNRAVLAHPSGNNPRPSELAFLGKNKPAVDVHSFVPNYIRLAEAEANWLEARKKDE